MWIRKPGWHLLSSDFLSYRLCPGTRCLVVQQGHRSNLSRPMALRAILIDYGRDIFVKRYGSRATLGGAVSGVARADGRQCQTANETDHNDERDGKHCFH